MNELAGLLAHPVTGEPSSGIQILIASAGAVIAFVGVALAVAAGRRPQGRRGLLALGAPLAVVGVLAAAFGPGLVEAGAGGCARPVTEARVEIVAPAPGQVVEGTSVPVTVTLAGGALAELTTTANRPDEGHLHVSLDGKLASMTGELDQVVQAEPGDHELTVEFVANDHAPFCTRVTDRVRFSVTG